MIGFVCVSERIIVMNKIKNLETNQYTMVSKLMRDYGVRIRTDGTPQFASQDEVSMWQYVVAVFGLPWALLRFFDRSEFPKAFGKNNSV